MKTSKFYSRIIVCIYLLFGLQSFALGASIASSDSPLNLASIARVLIDHTDSLDFQKIQTETVQEQFKLNQSGTTELNFGFSSATYWIKLSLSTDQLISSNWILEIPYFGLDQITLYSSVQGVIDTGSVRPLHTRGMFYRYYAFPINLNSDTQSFYLKIRSNQNISIPMRLWNQSSFDRHIQIDALTQGLYYGSIGVLAAFNLLIYIYLRDRSRLYYAAFAILFGLGIFAGNGLGRLFIWTDSPAWDQISQVVLLSLGTVMALFFTSEFLGTKKTQPVVNRILYFFAFVFTLYSAILALSSELGIHKNTLFALFPYLALPVIATVFYAGARACQSGQPSAKFFLIAWGALCIGGMMASFRQLDLIPTNWVTSYALQISSAIEMLLLSFALANHIQYERNLREKAQLEALTTKEALLLTLRSSEERLERQVQMRTNDLQSMLENEKKLREQYIRFGSLISHEFRSPLGIIENQTALLSRQIDHPNQKKRLTIISSATHRLALLFDRWLQGDRLENNIDRNRPQLIDLSSWLKDLIEKCKNYHPNHLFEFTDLEHGPILVVDERMLEVVVLNIIDNACKYSEPHSTVRIKIILKTTKVGISITDTGIGIDPDNQERIFEEYVQVKSDNNKRGYGLGLSFVKKTMAFYGGEVQVISALGEGSEFIAWFPDTNIAHQG